VKTTTQNNQGWIAAVGRACFRRRWIVVGIWLIVAVGGFFASGSVFNGLKSTPGADSLESVHAYSILDKQSHVGDSVLGEVTGVDPKSDAVRTAVTSAAAQIKTIKGVRTIVTPFDAGLPAPQAAALTATDGSGVLIDVTLDRLSDDAEGTSVDAVTAQMKSLESTLRSAAPPARVLIGGAAVLGNEVNDQVAHDLSLAEELSLPITLVVLVFVFGGIIAAGLPLFAAILSVFAAMAALLGFEHVTDLDQNATIVVTLLGLGLSIDYGLLLVARYREELGRGFDPETALGRAWASAGRTILFSAMTVAGSLCGLVVFGVTSMTALGIAGVCIAAIAMLVSLTATAALISLGRKRIRPSKRARRAPSDNAERGFFARLAKVVQARPVVTVIITAGVLLAAGLPLLQTRPSVDSLSSLPTSLPSVRVAHDLETRYGRDSSPAITVLAKSDPTKLDTWASQWITTRGVKAVAPAQAVGDGLSTVDVYVTGDPEGTAARDLVATMRDHRPPGTQSWVTGNAALLKDILGLIKDRLPWAIGITVLAMLVLLFLMTGSLVVPIKAIVMNALSLGATIGVMTLVFQDGYGSSVLHTLHTGSLDPFVIIGVLAFAFGLSMDYEVFLLSRIKEYVDSGLPSDVAVRRGLQKSGRVITSAALLMVIVFGSFLIGKVGNTQQIGLGLAAAIAIDATLVRCVLVPATMTLLGKWNWWAPRPLARWHARFAAPAFVETPEAPDRELQPVS
jgi:RND superfamily putative drug exporter